jgi:hypothetical protein
MNRIKKLVAIAKSGLAYVVLALIIAVAIPVTLGGVAAYCLGGAYEVASLLFDAGRLRMNSAITRAVAK